MSFKDSKSQRWYFQIKTNRNAIVDVPILKRSLMTQIDTEQKRIYSHHQQKTRNEKKIKHNPSMDAAGWYVVWF